MVTWNVASVRSGLEAISASSVIVGVSGSLEFRDNNDVVIRIYAAGIWIGVEMSRTKINPSATAATESKAP